MRIFAVAALLAICFQFCFVGAGVAQTGDRARDPHAFFSALKNCGQSESGSARNECIDNVATQFGPGARWTVYRNKSKIDDSETILLALGAFNVAQQFAREAFDALVDQKPSGKTPLKVYRVEIMCREGRTTFSINFADTLFFTSDGGDSVTYRIDDLPAEQLRFSITHKNDSLQLGKGAVPFIKKRLSAKRLVLRVHPFRQNDITHEFRLTGLSEKISEVRNACRW